MAKLDDLIVLKARELYNLVNRQITSRVPEATAIPLVEKAMHGVLTAMKSAAGASTKTEMQNLKATNADLEGEVGELKEKVDTLKKDEDPDVEGMKTKITELETANEELLAKVEELEVAAKETPETPEEPEK